MQKVWDSDFWPLKAKYLENVKTYKLFDLAPDRGCGGLSLNQSWSVLDYFCSFYQRLKFWPVRPDKLFLSNYLWLTQRKTQESQKCQGFFGILYQEHV